MINISNLKKNEKGVISLEACISVPFFVLILLFFYGLMVIFSGEQIIKHTLIQSAESLSLDPFATEKFEIKSLSDIIEGDEDPEIKEIILALYGTVTGSGNNKYYSSGKKWYSDEKETLLTETVRNRFLGYIAGSATNVEEKADEILKEIGVQGGINGLDFSETTVVEGTLTIVITYKQEFVFNFHGLAAFDRRLSISVDMWGLNGTIGKEG